MIDADFPIRKYSDDKLGRKPLVEHIAAMLIQGRGESRRATRLSVGLTGAWGSGKSSVIALLYNHLSSLANVFVVQFNPWLFQSHTDLIDSFFEEVEAQLGRGGSSEFRQFVKALHNYRDAISPALDTAFPGAGILAGFIQTLRDPSVLGKRRKLEKQLNALNGALVVLIDELDRIETEEIRSMARLIKAVADLPNVSYLISYDRMKVERALGDGDPISGAAYLEKIVQFPVPLRPLMSDEVHTLLDEALMEAGYSPGLGDKELKEELIGGLTVLLDTPRTIKRIVSSFAAMEPMVRGEVNQVDVLAYSIVCTKAPAVRDAIAEHTDDVVHDPINIYQRVLRSDRGETPSIEDTLQIPVDDKVKSLITFMFPRFGGEADRDRFGRIQYRRHLVTMLYLGDPPFITTRKEVDGFWSSPSLEFLREKWTDGTISDFYGLVDRLLPQLPATGDNLAWSIIADDLSGKIGQERVRARQAGRDLRSTLISFASRGSEGVLRAKSILEHLISEGDFGIVPDVLRYHMFSHGLVTGESPRGGPVIYDEETFEILRRELPRYREFVVSGQWLSGSEDADVIFALQQSGNWDDDLRRIAEDQVRRPPQLWELAALFIPPGWSLERGTLENFVSEEAVRSALASSELPDDPWLADCVTRLLSYLDGVDPDQNS